MAKISIIVPIYNVEKYLRECLNSLINQTFKDIEIICVNDGSTDNSLIILEEYKLKDDRIKIFSQENKGVSSARNLALENVKSEYIFFVDADDWIELNTCEVLYNTARKRETDILLFSYFNINNGIKTQDYRLLDMSLKFYDTTTNINSDCESLFATPTNVRGKFYEARFILDNKIYFDENFDFGEDRIFYFLTLFKAKRIGVLNEPFYNYRIDALHSLSKRDTIFYLSFLVNMEIKKIIFSLNDISNKIKIYKDFLEISAINNQLYYWNNFYNRHLKRQNFKYLLTLKKEFKIFSKNEKNNSVSYQKLCQEIKNYQLLFLTKLIEPFFELEFRRNRIVLYLFERQVLNFSTHKLNKKIYKMRYRMLLLKLRLVSKWRKVRVGLWMTENQKWSSFESLYKALKSNKNFEPIVLLSYLKQDRAGISKVEHMHQNIEFLEKNNIYYEKVFDERYNRFSYLKEQKPDIVFYQQPWSIHENQNLWNTSKTALTCYVPYCYYSLESDVNYFLGFHGCLWKYFVETEMHKKDYEKIYGAKNCVALGSTKLDNYNNISTDSIWANRNKKRIIYAPHHTFAFEYNYQMATFKENGHFILEWAKSHPEYEWVFRPHPVFLDRVVENNIMTYEEVTNYFAEWEKIGKVYPTGDYYSLFKESDCLITDCISFLAEYLPTGKPVIHLRKENQYKEFNSLLKIITDSYYKIYDNTELASILEKVLVREDDYLKEKRFSAMKLLMLEENKTTGEKITEYLLKELGIEV